METSREAIKKGSCLVMVWKQNKIDDRLLGKIIVCLDMDVRIRVYMSGSHSQ